MDDVDTTLYDPFSPSVHRDPFPLYRRLRDRRPVLHNASRGFWALSRFADVRTATCDWRTFANGAGTDLDQFGDVIGSGSVLNPDPLLHRQLKKAVRKPLTTTTVPRQEHAIRDIVTRALDSLLAAGGGETTVEFAWQVPTATISRILGIPAADVPDVKTLLFQLYDRRLGEPVGPGPHRAATRLRGYLQELAVERRARPKEDLISAIAEVEHEGNRFDEELGGILFLLLLAATETTASLLGSAVVALHDHPDQRDLLNRGKVTPEGAVEELLRHQAPIQNHPRITTRPVELHGTTIPEGAMVLLLYGSANRDERVWPDADILDLSRAPRPHLTFGDGVHLCVGAWLARLEAQIAVAEFARRVPRYEIGAGVRRLPIHSTRGFINLPISFAA
ncbi:cytochrome P450 [Streptomyces sp. NL15-2K]|uniref:cytochrome P450 n=1 Tax=Streptomyces sp. NL15-2K TaxID=376149 RepID=UPI000F56CC80|nr:MULTISPECIES: cytochrome P450 [Actinomycetes]WKX09526.1 cytochrome P450 [Kutzneria buriramensis]GCB48961.1 hypothetical protein SNL152K_6291 [Streptomyces sp. NL15-2K]